MPDYPSPHLGDGSAFRDHPARASIEAVDEAIAQHGTRIPDDVDRDCAIAAHAAGRASFMPQSWHGPATRAIHAVYRGADLFSLVLDEATNPMGNAGPMAKRIDYHARRILTGIIAVNEKGRDLLLEAWWQVNEAKVEQRHAQFRQAAE